MNAHTRRKRGVCRLCLPLRIGACRLAAVALAVGLMDNG